jgi:hypothetical protein
MSTVTGLVQAKRARTRLITPTPQRDQMRRGQERMASEGGAPNDDRPISLLDEAERRLRNSMHAIGVLVRLGTENLEPPSTQAVLTDMETRLQALAARHKALCRSGNFGQIDLAVFLKQVASLRNSPPRTPQPGGWLVEPGGKSLVWSRTESEPDVDAQCLDFDVAAQALPPAWRELARRAVCASAVVFPPWLFRWGSPSDGAEDNARTKPGDVGLRLRTRDLGVIAEVSLPDRGPGRPDQPDPDQLRALSLELGAVLGGLVQGCLNAVDGFNASFEVRFVRSEAPDLLAFRPTRVPDTQKQRRAA